MSPCSPNDVSIDVPDGPGGPAIPGFGPPFSPKLPNINPFPDGFPEDLLDLLDKLQLLVPPGALKPQLNPNFGKDVFDGIMKLLDQFMPFLMLYKFFLPILNMIICIIEVLCALMNPFKLIRALKRLFRTCIPEFLNMFPIFALICMIISLLLLILALIEYVIEKILQLIKALLRNIAALEKAFSNNNAVVVLAIAKKLGSLLCIFQNLFVLFAIFNIIIQIIKDILALIFHIPPCDDGDDNDNDKCCTPDVCPAIIKNGNYTRFTGSLQYVNQVGVTTSSFPGGSITADVRSESWQLFDTNQEIAQKFSNIIDPFDTPSSISPKPVLFPTDGTFSDRTPPKQAPYTVDLRFLYAPKAYGRPGEPRFIRFKDCVVTKLPTRDLNRYDNSKNHIDNGVLMIAGGLGFEDDGRVLTGYDANIVNIPIPEQATLNNFLHKKSRFDNPPLLIIPDEITLSGMEYTFKPNVQTLLQKNLITAGCAPDFSVDRQFINAIITGEVAVKTDEVKKIFDDPGFPDPGKAQQEFAAALDDLRNNLTVDGVAQFQNASTVILTKLKDDTNNSLSQLIGTGFDPCKSSISISSGAQFTSKPIEVSVTINERNGLSLTTGLPVTVANDLAQRISPHITFGQMSPFTYDGSKVFTAHLTSNTPGAGQLMISFDNNIFCTDTIPADLSISPTHTLQTVNYQFVYTPSGKGASVTPGSSGAGGTGTGGTSDSSGASDTGGGSGTGSGDSTGQPRRDEGDQSRDGNGNGDE